MNILEFFQNNCSLEHSQIKTDKQTTDLIVPILGQAVNFFKDHYGTDFQQELTDTNYWMSIIGDSLDAINEHEALYYNSLLQISLTQCLPLSKAAEISKVRAMSERARLYMEFLPQIDDGGFQCMALIKQCLSALHSEKTSPDILVSIGRLSSTFLRAQTSVRVLDELASEPDNKTKRGVELSKDHYTLEVMKLLLSKITDYYSETSKQTTQVNQKDITKISLYKTVQSKFPEMTKEGFKIDERDKWLNRLIDYSLELHKSTSFYE